MTSSPANGGDRMVGRLARGLYETRRREVLESVRGGLRVQGVSAQMDADGRTLSWRYDGLEMVTEFRTRRQLFGAHLHLVYSTAVGGTADGEGSVGYRWGVVGRRGFVAKRGSSPDVAELTQRLNGDDDLVALLRDSAVRAIGVQHVGDPPQWRVLLEPVPGVISVVYFPPVPPFAVRLQPDEVRGHVKAIATIVEHIRAS